MSLRGDTPSSDGEAGAGTPRFEAPNINLPKSGGAIRGIGEKFAANPVTGTGSMTVPVATSPGRGGFGPQLALSYDSGAGNGPFGFGWTLALPAISRKTDKGLPLYQDATESDVFILSGTEDLVPLLAADGTRWEDGTLDAAYVVHRYRPRVEGLFARIERWTRKADGDTHWRSVSRDNVLSLYGKDANSRIADPTEPTRVFRWLICETRDDKGNALLYEYKPEDGVGVDLTAVHERNRGDRDDPRRSTNRYVKRIRYGNRPPLLDAGGGRPRTLSDAQVAGADWMFEVVFDYGEHDDQAPTPQEVAEWTYRMDPFSSYRSGFEVRTQRLCQRVLMFHHFEAEPDVGNDCLVRSTDFTYSSEQDPTDARSPVYTFLRGAFEVGYRRQNGGYLARSLPPLEFDYTEPVVDGTVRDVDQRSLEHLPIGVDGAVYTWVDLHGEGIAGILTEQAGAWWYTRNVSPIGEHPVEFAATALVAEKPNVAVAAGEARFMDLDGDGQPDLVVLGGPMPGLYEHDDRRESWKSFRAFTSRLNADFDDRNLRLVDVDGDGRSDVLITEGDAFSWHAALGEEGFGPAQYFPQGVDEEQGPRLVFSDGTGSLYLADLSGDGLTDLVRIRNGECCYWPNQGRGFGAKVTMDNAPHFDHPDEFDHDRLRLADIDGSGTIDLLYLHRDGVRLYYNQSGNSWSVAHELDVAPATDDVVDVTVTDLLGNGTACLVWSSPLPEDRGRTVRYVDLMGGRKPHLLVRTSNNLGAETRVEYASSAKFYLRDKRDGRPWISRLPFPVQVAERVETYDHISRSRFVTRYAYHHGYFDGEEREFRGFGMVEQWDTELMAALSESGAVPAGDNVDLASYVPPVQTKTWFHTGVYAGRDHVSDFLGGLLGPQDEGEYYREPGVTDAQARTLLLPDTVLPAGLTLEEEREACRALKGSMLRQEVYAIDGVAEAEHPYTVTEQNFTIRRLQSRGDGRHAVFFVHANEAVNYHYERNPADPRMQHRITLEVDDFGNTLKEVAAGYGRRQPDATLPVDADRSTQTRTLVTYTEHRLTNPIGDADLHPNDYRTPLSCETRRYELTGYVPTGPRNRYQPSDFVQPDPGDPGRLTHVYDDDLDYEEVPTAGRERRLIEHVRILWRKDDLTALLELGAVEPLALRGDRYRLAFTSGLLRQVYVRDGQALLPADPADILGRGGADRGGYASSGDLKAAGLFPSNDPDDHWWIPDGRAFLSPGGEDTAAQELAHARDHFFLPCRYRDPFHTDAVSTERLVSYDAYDLLMVESRDPLGNRVTLGERLLNGDLDPATPGNDYRVLQPRRMMDENGNRRQVEFNALGMVVGTAVMGKPEESLGDSLAGLEADPPDAVVLDHLANPLTNPSAILARASARLVYDLFAYYRTRDQPNPQPVVTYTLARETHEGDLQAGQQTKVQHSFSYSDGFGREIQRKLQAEPGPLVTGGAVISPRWVGSGWTIFNNKAKAVRQYEPFFTTTHRFEFGVQAGVSSILFYDPVGRVVATLHPNHTYEKVVFDAWPQATWDVNDTVLRDPRTDADIQGLTAGYFAGLPASPPAPPWQTWHSQRQSGALGAQEQDAADKAAAHAETPTTAHFDAVGRPFLTLADNRLRPGTARPASANRDPRRVGYRGQPAHYSRCDRAGGRPAGAHRHAVRLRHAGQPYPAVQHGFGRALGAQ